jgi:hypothetical protein
MYEQVTPDLKDQMVQMANHAADTQMVEGIDFEVMEVFTRAGQAADHYLYKELGGLKWATWPVLNVLRMIYTTAYIMRISVNFTTQAIKLIREGESIIGEITEHAAT